MSAGWQRVRIPIPEHFDAAQRAEIGKEIVEFIRQRTESGVGVKERGGKFVNYKFPGYSKTYIESLDFKIAGKSKNKVDLTLSGDMLIAMDVLGHEPGSILIGYEAGSEENDRADGNATGSYGGDPNPRKARSFLGVTDAELKLVLGKFES
jgi:hypothetical protein